MHMQYKNYRLLKAGSRAELTLKLLSEMILRSHLPRPSAMGLSLLTGADEQVP